MAKESLRSSRTSLHSKDTINGELVIDEKPSIDKQFNETFNNESINNITSSKSVDDLERLKTPRLVFSGDEVSDELKECLTKVYLDNYKSKSLPELIETMKKRLDKSMGVGWVVFAGKHMAGVCCYIANTLAQFEVDNTIFVVFKTFYVE